MVITELKIKNFKSFGNNEQVIKLNEKEGKLILLMGSNGNGKSSLLQSIEYVLYGKVKGGKQRKWNTLSSLPNRINGDMLVKIKLISNGTDIEIQRGIAPNVLNLIENGLPNERAGKVNLDDKIQNYIGLDIETFKSFISMSINDFKNFISLSNEEKQLLLDKLFNLEIINILNSILKDLNKSNKVILAKFDSEIETLNDSITSIKESIKRSLEKEKQNIEGEIETLKKEMASKKGDFDKLKEKMSKISEKEEQINNEISTEKEQYINIQNDIKNVQKEIDLYNLGKCPTCRTDFETDHFQNLKDILLEKKESILKIKAEVEGNLQKIKEKQNKLNTLSSETESTYNDMLYYLKNLKEKITKLQGQKDDKNMTNESIIEFEKSITELENKKGKSIDKQSLSKDKEVYYKELSKIFGEEGVKKSIIAGIIKPINFFIKENINKMSLPFSVVLDDTFSAQISTLGREIEHETLSTGESKLINLSILLGYLKLIRTKKFINILFLDEVFSSIDLENIDKILVLLKSFANEYNINIFVVHHASLKQEMFDRIIRINKNVFSTLDEIDLTQEEI